MSNTRYVIILALGLLASAGCARLASQWTIDHPDPRPDDPLAAARFRYFQRLSEDGTVPADALLIAKRQRDEMVRAAGTRGPGNQPAFTWLGPGNVGGRIRPIIIHPTQPNTMWVGAASGGIWKTTDGGAAWLPLDDYLPSLAVGCMAISPADPQVLFAGTGEGFFETIEGSSNTAAVRGAGIFKTTDGGSTWTQIPSTAGPAWYFVNRLAIQPQNSQLMLAATGSGLYRSTDGGDTWAQTAPGVVYDVQFHPTDATRAIAGRHDGTPLYSLNGGQTWVAATGASGHRGEVRYARSNPTIVYCTVSNNNGTITIHRSTNGGQSYTARAGGISTYAAYNNVVWVHPTNPDFLLVGSIQMYRSTDGGASTSQAFNGLHADHHGIVEHPAFNGTSNRTVFFGTDGGIYRTDDVTGSAVTELNNNLGITQFYGAAINPASGVVLAGAQDNGTTRYAGNAEGWTATFGGDGGYCAADPTDANYFYGEVQYLRIFRSTDAGQTASYVYNGITDAATTNTNFIPFFMLDPNNENRMLGTARRLWRSDNIKAATPTWTSIKATIQPEPEPDPGDAGDAAHFAPNSPWNIATVAIATGNSNVIWVGYNNGQLWKTSNGTAASPNWTRVDVDGSNPPDRWVSTIVIHPTDHNRVYVALMGWNDYNLWMTPNGGASWVDISGTGATGVPAAPASALAQHRVHTNRLYAGTDIGLFLSLDEGQTWFASTTGPGTVPVEQLNWRDDNTLLVVTHGRGVYLADVTPSPCAGDFNGDRAVGLEDLALLLAAFGACQGGVGYDPALDLDGSSCIDLPDLAQFLALFGSTCP